MELFESSRLLYGRDGIWNEARASVAAEKKPRAMDDSCGPLPGMNARGSSPYCTWNTVQLLCICPPVKLTCVPVDSTYPYELIDWHLHWRRSSSMQTDIYVSVFTRFSGCVSE